MKKLILMALMLTLITTVAWASEITLTPGTDGHTTVVGDDPGAVPVPPKSEHNGLETLSWDDGEVDGYFEDICNRAVQFTAPFDCHVVTGLVYREDDGILSCPYYFAIYNDQNEGPGTELGGVMTSGGTVDGWYDIDLTTAELALNEGDVFYGVVVKNNGEEPLLCADTTEPLNDPAIHGNFYKEGSQMGWLFDDTANLMLRVIVDDDVAGPFTDNPNPAPGDSGVHGDATMSFEICDDNHSVMRKSITVVVAGDDVTGECTMSQSSVTGSYIVTYTPEKGFDNGDVYVYWYAEDELGNGGEDTWHFTVEDGADDSNTVDTTWGVIKDTF
jgi:hypothetical protein